MQIFNSTCVELVPDRHVAAFMYGYERVTQLGLGSLGSGPISHKKRNTHSSLRLCYSVHGQLVI